MLPDRCIKMQKHENACQKRSKGPKHSKPNMCENAPCEQICIKSPTQGLGWAPNCFKAMKTWPPAAKRSPSSAENNTVKVYLAKCWQITRPFLKNIQERAGNFTYVCFSCCFEQVVRQHACILFNISKKHPTRKSEANRQGAGLHPKKQVLESLWPVEVPSYPLLRNNIAWTFITYIFKVVELICMNARRANTINSCDGMIAHMLKNIQVQVLLSTYQWYISAFPC